MALKTLRIFENIQGFRAFQGAGSTHFEVICIPPFNGQQWHLDKILQDAEKRQWLGRLLSSLKIDRVFAPNVGAMSAIVESPAHFTTSWKIAEELTLYSNPSSPADGTSLPIVGDAMILPAAGCKLLVAVGRSTLVAAHGGFRSFFDWDEVRTGNASRPHASVIESMRERLELHANSVRTSSMFGFFGIPRDSFRYPFTDRELYGNFQEYAVRKGWGADTVIHDDEAAYPDLDKIVVAQSKHYGFKSVSNQRALPIDKEFAVTRHADPRLREARNLVICIRRNPRQ